MTFSRIFSTGDFISFCGCLIIPCPCIGVDVALLFIRLGVEWGRRGEADLTIGLCTLLGVLEDSVERGVAGLAGTGLAGDVERWIFAGAEGGRSVR